MQRRKIEKIGQGAEFMQDAYKRHLTWLIRFLNTDLRKLRSADLKRIGLEVFRFMYGRRVRIPMPPIDKELPQRAQGIIRECLDLMKTELASIRRSLQKTDSTRALGLKMGSWLGDTTLTVSHMLENNGKVRLQFTFQNDVEPLLRFRTFVLFSNASIRRIGECGECSRLFLTRKDRRSHLCRRCQNRHRQAAFRKKNPDALKKQRRDGRKGIKKPIADYRNS